MWFMKFIVSSIGKKLVMAFSGLLLMLFLAIHALGNSLIFFGSTAFQTYAHTLHSLPVVVLLFSLGLLVLFFAHISFGLYLFFENRREGDSRYAVSVRTVKNSLASRTMHWTGLFIFFFLIIHISGFTFGPKDILISVSVQQKLGGFLYGLFYLLAFGALSLHLSHGFWSMLQTFGFNHPRYNKLIALLNYIIPALFFAVFGGIVLYFMTGIGTNY